MTKEQFLNGTVFLLNNYSTSVYKCVNSGHSNSYYIQKGYLDGDKNFVGYAFECNIKKVGSKIVEVYFVNLNRIFNMKVRFEDMKAVEGA